MRGFVKIKDMKKFLVMLILLLCFTVSERAGAKSVTWTAPYIPQLQTGANSAGGYAYFYSASVLVTYGADMVDISTGQVIADNAVLPVGYQFRVVPKARENTDISWFLAGYWQDSPYGKWTFGGAHDWPGVLLNLKYSNVSPYGYYVAGGDTLTYDAKTITCIESGYNYNYYHIVYKNADCSSYAQIDSEAKQVYENQQTNHSLYKYGILASIFNAIGEGTDVDPLPQFFVDDPQTSIVATGPMSCAGDICTVTGIGSLNIGVVFSPTSGRFRYPDMSPLTWDWSNVTIGLQQLVLLDTGRFFDFSPYTLPVPSQTIPFTLTAIQGNNLPTTPTVTPQPFTGSTNTSYPFSFTSTDPDNDQIAYEVDWNNDSLPDASTPFDNSGTSQSLSNPLNQWPTDGTFTFQVRAKDSQGGYSAWATAQVTLSSVSNGVCGPATLVPSGPSPTIGLCTSGTPTLVSQSGNNWTWGCNGSGGGTSTLPDACITPVETYTLSAERNPLGTGTGTITDTTPTATSIDSTLGRNSESVSYNATRTLRAAPTSSSISWSGCTSVSGDDCTVNNITSDQTVTATFTRLPEPGVCGPSDGASFSTLNAGSSGLCTSGAVDSFSLSGTTYSWNCNGMMGSPVNDSCFATQTRDYNWREVSP